MARPTKPEGTTADRIVAFRLTPTDEALLAAIVAANVKKLADDGTIASVRTSDVVRTLIRREALRLGVLSSAVAAAPPVPSTTPAAVPAARAPRAKTAAPAAAAPAAAPTTPADVHAALLAFLEKGGMSQAELSRASGVDRGQVSRFKKDGAGLSPEKLEALMAVIQSNA